MSRSRRASVCRAWRCRECRDHSQAARALHLDTRGRSVHRIRAALRSRSTSVSERTSQSGRPRGSRRYTESLQTCRLLPWRHCESQSYGRESRSVELHELKDDHRLALGSSSACRSQLHTFVQPSLTCAISLTTSSCGKPSARFTTVWLRTKSEPVHHRLGIFLSPCDCPQLNGIAQRPITRFFTVRPVALAPFSTSGQTRVKPPERLAPG
jgi:hypothetical protein